MMLTENSPSMAKLFLMYRILAPRLRFLTSYRLFMSAWDNATESTDSSESEEIEGTFTVHPEGGGYIMSFQGKAK